LIIEASARTVVAFGKQILARNLLNGVRGEGKTQEESWKLNV